MKHGKGSLANRVIRPRYISCDLLVGIGIVDNGRRKELVRVVTCRDRTVHRNGSGVGSTGRSRGDRKSEDDGHGHHHDGQHMTEHFTHDDHSDQDHDGGEHASTSRQNTASKHQLNTS